MPRPRKCRRICGMPSYSSFQPQGENNNGIVELLVEEYEVIRLIDYEKLTQEECASMMGIARTSVQKMYDEARYKMAQMLIDGKSLKIMGGNYYVCENKNQCDRGFCQGFRNKNNN